jgi:hypothetical protein
MNSGFNHLAIYLNGKGNAKKDLKGVRAWIRVYMLTYRGIKNIIDNDSSYEYYKSFARYDDVWKN